MTGPLAGYTVGITAARRAEELGTALERRGAGIVYGPAIQLVPLPDDAELRSATGRCLNAPLDVVVVTTGIGFRGWLEAAEGWGLAGPLTASLGRAALLARGPKARGAIRGAGLREQWSPSSESSAEVLDHLVAHGDLAGKRIAVQLHGEDLSAFTATLRQRGAEVIGVPVYRWTVPDDPTPLHRLLDLTAGRRIDAVAFTSAPAANSFLRVAADRGVDVRGGFGAGVLAACVGPVTAAPLLAEGVDVLVAERGRLGALVRAISAELPSRRPRVE